ncbi:MAG TPA: ABC transporter permease, partial [Candidatus Acidoferrum sp.]
MKVLASLGSVLSALFLRKRLENDTDEELRAHVQNRADDLERRGLTRGEAERRARIEFGGHEKFKEECREAARAHFLHTSFQDLRFALRMLRKNPGFTAVALLTIAIGIGANAAVFSVVNSVLLKPLNYPKPEELVALRQVAPGAAGLADFESGLLLSPSMYVTYAEQNRTFQSLGVWVPDTANVTGLAEPEQVRVVDVSDGVLQALGVPPEVGRWLSPGDQVPRGPQRVMLNYGYWQGRFGGDRAVIGRSILVDSRPREIVGVMPQGFRFADTDFDLIVPLAFDRGTLILAGFGFHGIARLKTGVRIMQANADLTRMLPIWMDSWSNGPGSNPHIYETWRITPMIRPLKQE